MTSMTSPSSPSPSATSRTPIELTINGRVCALSVEPRRTLLDALREDLHLTGAKPGCNMGQCGACTILLDGEAVYSCLLLAIECQGHAIKTSTDIGNVVCDGLVEGEARVVFDDPGPGRDASV